jgi:hypothetical protein
MGLEKDVEFPCDGQPDMPSDAEILNVFNPVEIPSNDEGVILVENLESQLSKDNHQTDHQTTTQIENAAFLLSLTEQYGVSQVAVKEVVSRCRQICQQSVTAVQRNISEALQDEGITVSQKMKVTLTSIPDLKGLELRICSTSFAEKTSVMWLLKKFPLVEHTGPQHYLDPNEKRFNGAIFSIMYLCWKP